MLPKYHCEFNPIERVWAQAKQYTKAHCKYSIVSLQKTITPALESASLKSIQNTSGKSDIIIPLLTWKVFQVSQNLKT